MHVLGEHAAFREPGSVYRRASSWLTGLQRQGKLLSTTGELADLERMEWVKWETVDFAMTYVGYIPALWLGRPMPLWTWHPWSWWKQCQTAFPQDLSLTCRSGRCIRQITIHYSKKQNMLLTRVGSTSKSSSSASMSSRMIFCRDSRTCVVCLGRI